MNPGSEAMQTVTPIFIEQLKTRHFSSPELKLVRLQGHELTISYLLEKRFDKPILVETSEGLDMKMPHESLTTDDIKRLVGAKRRVSVIKVATQSEISMPFGKFVSYFKNKNKRSLMNLINLEISGTRLNSLVEPPLIVRNLDWANYVCPVPTIDNIRQPSISKYCLMGVKDSYTNFHIDFGGSSFWYHVLTGEKVFYLIEPTNYNLKLYTRWCNSSNIANIFFGDQVKHCYSVNIKAGNTIFVPSGWIHAVFTPIDTIVFGGNFIHNLNIPMQLRIFDVEKLTNIPMKFRFPNFQAMHWYAARNLCSEIKKSNDGGSQYNMISTILGDIKGLVLILKQWNQEKDNGVEHSETVPPSIQGLELINNINKEIRVAEQILNTVNPLKPVRKSERKKKKPVHLDFVDYFHPLRHVSHAIRASSNYVNKD